MNCQDASTRLRWCGWAIPVMLPEVSLNFYGSVLVPSPPAIIDGLERQPTAATAGARGFDFGAAELAGTLLLGREGPNYAQVLSIRGRGIPPADDDGRKDLS